MQPFLLPSDDVCCNLIKVCHLALEILMFEGFPIVCKSMETNDPRGVAKHDWHNFCKRPLAIATYQISVGLVVSENIFLVFPFVSLWELSVTMETTILKQSALKLYQSIPQPNDCSHKI